MEVVLHAQFHPLDEGYVSLSHGGSEPVTEIEDQAESTMTDCPHGYFVRTLEDSSLEFLTIDLILPLVTQVPILVALISVSMIHQVPLENRIGQGFFSTS